MAHNKCQGSLHFLNMEGKKDICKYTVKPPNIGIGIKNPISVRLQ